MMKLILMALITKVFTFINYIAPKFERKVSFLGYPDFDDTLRGMLPHIEKELVVLAHNELIIIPDWVPQNVTYCRKKSLTGIYHLLTSKTIYFTHGVSIYFDPIKENRQKVINLWHGMPLKNIGLLDTAQKISRSHYSIASSNFFKGVIAKAFGMKSESVIVCGLPRNEILLSQSANSTIISIQAEYDKVFVWLPTYRKSTEGDVRVDGKELPLYGFDEFDISSLNEILKSINAALYIKPHPMSALADAELVCYSNVFIINEEWLGKKSITLYELLSISDELWTDFSSVYIDYLVTGKAIKFVINDLNEYESSRGFTFDIVSHGFPGELILTQEALFTSIISPANDLGLVDLEHYHSIKRFDFELLESCIEG